MAWAAGPFQFSSVTPCRIIDTRGPTGLTGGPALVGDVQRNFPIDVAPAACGIPNDAAAAVLNFVVVAPGGGGHLRVWPFGTTFPGVATLNFDPDEPAIGNGAITPVTIDPNFQISVVLKTGGPSGHLVVDVTGTSGSCLYGLSRQRDEVLEPASPASIGSRGCAQSSARSGPVAALIPGGIVLL